MSPTTRLLVGLVLRLVLLFFAGWFAFASAALPVDTHIISRLGIVTAFIILFMLVGEVSAMRMHMGMLVNALRASGKQGGVATTVVEAAAAMGVSPGGGTRNDAASVDILIKALGAGDESVRSKAHVHLSRLTGQSIPADVAAWQAWWDENRDTFQSPSE